MKANEAKRKIFTDAVDLIGGGESEVSGANCVEMLDIDAISLLDTIHFICMKEKGSATWLRA